MSIDWALIRLKATAEYLQLVEEIKPVQGFLLDLQGYTLMLLAEEGPGAGSIVEIGSFMGKSTCWLARGAKRAQREKVYAIDPFTGSPEHQSGGICEVSVIAEDGSTFPMFEQNIRALGVLEQVVPIVARSEDAARDWHGPIRLLFIDGDHSYEASKLDFDLWSPFVVPGGIIVFHDIGEWEGVTRFYNEHVITDPRYKQLLNLYSMCVVVKSAS
ncbi:MAG: class I SAM-dependent methyltransferase [Candidatus Hydrogenedentes bacterium]|nr:class I SAM-dependent methyltransferase [Candidatus Hydrogenedentota bacterium]